MNDEIDRGLALRYRVAALISGVLACAGVTGAGAHLSLGDTFLATPWVVFSVAAFVWVRAYAMRAAHELCARRLMPAVALRYCGGIRGVLFPRRVEYLPPRRGGR
jgi:hypothetical protein